MHKTRDGVPSLQIEQFLKDLGEVSYRHGLAISEHGEVFLMEENDYESRYWLRSDDYLSFGA